MAESESPSKPPGLVYTFYSYKGGVGRSMALVNIGVLMAIEGYRVLLVDWDLEAPGLEVFFRKAATISRDPESTPGIVDLLDAQAQGNPIPWCDCLLRADFFGKSVDILSAGKRTDEYRRRVQQLDWETLFREHRIGNYINTLREEWRAKYDFVLVDSRTGITDIGDICTVILPDVLVLLFVTNHQNVEGVKKVMARAVAARAKLPTNRSKLLGVPVPARDERDRESDKFDEWKRIFADEFGQLYREWLPKEVDPLDALHRIYIPYVAGWSFGERIPVIESDRERNDPSSLGAAFGRLAALLSRRLDWSAIEAKASTADVIGARVELSKAREEAREAELRLADEAKRRERSEQVAVRSKKLTRVIAVASLVAFALPVWWLYSNKLNMAKEGKEFAQEAFQKVAVQHDLNFFSSRLSPQARMTFPPSAQQELMNEIVKFGAPVRPVDVQGKIEFQSQFFEPHGSFHARIYYPARYADMNLTISHPVGRWQIDEIAFIPQQEQAAPARK